MEKIELLPVSDDVHKAIEATDANYRRFIQVRTDILDVQGNVLTVRVEQFKRLTDKVFTPKELIEKGKEVFSHLPDGFTIRWRPLVFAGEGIEAVSAEWVRNQLKKHGMKQQTLADDLGVDKHALSKLLSNEFGFTSWHKAAFYHYFKALS